MSPGAPGVAVSGPRPGWKETGVIELAEAVGTAGATTIEKAEKPSEPAVTKEYTPGATAENFRAPSSATIAWWSTEPAWTRNA
jgi:hypothetical protein